MSLTFWFWLFMAGLAAASVWWGWGYELANRPRFGLWGLLLFVLLLIIGLKLFGHPIQP